MNFPSNLDEVVKFAVENTIQKGPMRISSRFLILVLLLNLEIVIPKGFEPLTHRLEICCSIQLSYGTILKHLRFEV